MESRFAMKGNTLVLCITLSLVIACKGKVPSQYPDQAEMTELLVDLQMAEATMSNSPNTNANTEKQSQGYYKYVLDKHHLTKNDFDSALIWYAAHPVIYQKVYDDVIAILSEQEAQNKSFVSKEDEKEKLFAAKMKVLSLWKDSSSYKYPIADSIDHRLPFSIKTDSLKLGDVKLSASFKFKKEDETKKNEMVLITLFSDQKRDTFRFEIKKSFSESSAFMSAPVDSNRFLVGLKGYLLYHDSIAKSFVDVNGIHLDFVPRPVLPRK